MTAQKQNEKSPRLVTAALPLCAGAGCWLRRWCSFWPAARPVRDDSGRMGRQQHPGAGAWATGGTAAMSGSYPDPLRRVWAVCHPHLRRDLWDLATRKPCLARTSAKATMGCRCAYAAAGR